MDAIKDALIELIAETDATWGPTGWWEARKDYRAGRRPLGREGHGDGRGTEG